jgi:hypothetical protein
VLSVTKLHPDVISSTLYFPNNHIKVDKLKAFEFLSHEVLYVLN